MPDDHEERPRRWGFLRKLTQAQRTRDERLAKVLGDRGVRDDKVLADRIYRELRTIAAATVRRQGAASSLQPTMLVHEAYCKLFDGAEPSVNDRRHFFALAAVAMRQVVVDRVRRRGRRKRGGDLCAVSLHESALAAATHDVDATDLDSALHELAARDPRQAKIVELKFFGGLEVQEIADVLGTSKRTVERAWQDARNWLADRLGAGA